MIFYYIFSFAKDLKHILHFLSEHVLVVRVVFFVSLTNLCSVNFLILQIAFSYKDFLFVINVFSLLWNEKIQRLRRMVMLKLWFIKDPQIFSSFKLSNRNSWFTLTLTEEMIPFPKLVWPFISRTTAVTLTDKTLTYFSILIGLVPSFRISYPSQAVQFLKLVLKIIFCSFNVCVEKIL